MFEAIEANAKFYSQIVERRNGYEDGALLKELVENAAMIVANRDCYRILRAMEFMAGWCVVSNRVRENLHEHPKFIDAAKAFMSISPGHIDNIVRGVMVDYSGEETPYDLLCLAQCIVEGESSPGLPLAQPLLKEFRQTIAALGHGSHCNCG